MATDSSLGFTSQYRDPVTGGYPLGNGYRMYLSGLMRFSTPDSCSPFGRGGVNPYAYCAADPVNRRDPSGHMDSSIGEFFERVERSENIATEEVVKAFDHSDSIAAKESTRGAPADEPNPSWPYKPRGKPRDSLRDHRLQWGPLTGTWWPGLENHFEGQLIKHINESRSRIEGLEKNVAKFADRLLAEEADPSTEEEINNFESLRSAVKTEQDRQSAMTLLRNALPYVRRRRHAKDVASLATRLSPLKDKMVRIREEYFDPVPEDEATSGFDQALLPD